LAGAEQTLPHPQQHSRLIEAPIDNRIEIGAPDLTAQGH
jgi:hypothetical protein